MIVKYDIDSNYLKKEYIEEDKSASDIAKDIGCSKTTIRNYLIKYGITKNKSLVGKTFSRLTVIERFYTDSEKYKWAKMWKCQCLCGNTSILSTHQLKSGNTKSCGCWIRINRHNYKNWKGHKEITGKWWGGIKRGAVKRGHKFEVTMDYVWDLFVQQNRKCALSNLPIAFALTNRQRATASLDRIDNTKGYIKGNVQWLHKDVNYMKQKYTQEYFIEICKEIAWKNK